MVGAIAEFVHHEVEGGPDGRAGLEGVEIADGSIHAVVKVAVTSRLASLIQVAIVVHHAARVEQL